MNEGDTTMPKVYIAGPMRGIPQLNFPAFDHAAALGRKLGWTVISPADLDRTSGVNEMSDAPVAAAMIRAVVDRDATALLSLRAEEGDAVALLPGFERSTGATAEIALARWLGLSLLDALTFKPLEVRFAAAPVSVEPQACVVNNTTAVRTNGCEVEGMCGFERDLATVGFTIKDSGERQSFDGGMVRDIQKGKILYHLVFDGPMYDRWAEHMTKGAAKYSEGNWLKAEGEAEYRRFKASAARHFRQWFRGDTDEDHPAAVFFNLNGAEYVKAKLQSPADGPPVDRDKCGTLGGVTPPPLSLYDVRWQIDGWGGSPIHRRFDRGKLFYVSSHGDEIPSTASAALFTQQVGAASLVRCNERGERL